MNPDNNKTTEERPSLEIVTDEEFLQGVCEPVTDKNISELQETLDFFKTMSDRQSIQQGFRMAGLAANQIGKKLRVILVQSGKGFNVFINPRPTFKGKTQKSEETCFSRPGKDPVEVDRYKFVKVESDNHKFASLIKVPDGFNLPTNVVKLQKFDAIVLQHEVDHLNGILI